MRFGIVTPTAKTIRFVNARSVREAVRMAGVDPDKTDHGVVVRGSDGGGIGVVVFEFGFYVPAERQQYFAMGDRLYAGPAVLYQFNEQGATVDLHGHPPPMWLDTKESVEMAITLGFVPRPEIKVNGEVIWSWPQPAPPDLVEEAR